MCTDTPLSLARNPGTLFVASHSGGKDSQAMLIDLLDLVPRSQLAVIHADLGELEWPGARQLAETQARDAGLPFLVAHAFFKDGRPKSFFDKLEHQWGNSTSRPPFPGPRNRWCTSELKTGPIEREIRRYAKAHGFHTVVMCTGLRAQESEDRRAKVPFAWNKDNSCQGRAWFDWLPIHEWTTLDVFQAIERAGQEPHPQYGVVSIEGEPYATRNERLSCKFCIFGSKADLRNGAQADPALYARFTAWEERTGYTLHVDRKPLAQLIAEAALGGA